MTDVPLIHIPTYHTSLIGRSQDVAALTAQLHDPDTRLLTILGPSGSGKTRLALEVATSIASAFPDGVVFVALAPVQDQRFVLPTMAQAVEVREDGDTPLLTILGEYFASRRMLLILDNVEQVIACAADLATLLTAAPGLTLMVTSQIPLGLPTETIYPLPPLAVPSDTGPTTPASVLAYPAINLFVERLQAVQPRFQLTPANVDVVVEICQRLDGFPLAIELVAAHSATLDPRDLLLLLQRHLAMPSQVTAVSGSSRTAILYPVLDWCTSRLSAQGKALLLRIGIFWGGWTTEAAHAIIAPEDDLETVAEALALLVQKHLVQVETLPGQQPRYVVLDAIHEYSRDRLHRQRRDGPLRARHAAYYAGLTQQAADTAKGASLPQWMQRLREEVHNLRAALQWNLDQPDPSPLLQMAQNLFVFWDKQGWYREACGWVEPALIRAPSAPAIHRARAWNLVGSFSIDLGSFARAKEALEESINLFAQAGDLGGQGAAVGNLGLLLSIQGRLSESKALYEQSLELVRRCIPPDERRLSTALNNLGAISLDEGDLAAARRYYEESLAIRRQREDHNLPTSISNLANLALLQGDFTTAQALLDEGIAMAERVGDIFSLNLLQTNRGLLALEQGDGAVATAQVSMVLANHQAANNPIEQLSALQILGYIALVEHTWPQAEAWLSQAHTLCVALGPNEYRTEVSLQRSRLAMAQADDTAAWTLVQDTIQVMLEDGKRLLLPEVAEQAALILLQQGARDQAIDLWHRAEANRRMRGIPRLPSLLRWYGDQASALVVESTVLPSPDPDDLSSRLAGLVSPVYD